MNEDTLRQTTGIRWRLERFARALDQKLAGKVDKLSFAETEAMKDFRTTLGLSRKHLAEICGTTERTVENLETGVSNSQPTIREYFRSMLAYIDALSVPERRMPEWLDVPIGTWAKDQGSLSGLLDPEMRSVQFHGNSRKRLLKAMGDWCETEEPVQIQSVRADAGMGKTRLGVELCRKLSSVDSGDANDGWIVGFVRPQFFPKETSPWETANLRGQNVLLVFDYAGGPESLPVIKRLLPHLVEPPTKRLRILFLDRVDYWLSELRREKAYSDVHRKHGISRTFSQPEIGDAFDNGGREGAFTLAVKGFQDKLESKAQVATPSDLGKPLFARVLMLHMRALLATVGSNGSASEREILEECLDRERRQWEYRMSVRGVELHLFNLVEKVFWLISSEGGAVDIEQATRIASEDRAFASLPAYLQEPLLGVLHDCYASSGRYIEPMRPDLLGEYFIAKEPRPLKHA